MSKGILILLLTLSSVAVGYFAGVELTKPQEQRNCLYVADVKLGCVSD